MKNLFSFATKELSQDAFLRWLFESYDDEDLRGAVNVMLSKFCKLKDDEHIIDIKTYAQLHNIDIKVSVKTDKRKFELYIEDKVYSSEHNQLSRYNKVTDSGNEVYKIFFKPARLSVDDDKGIDNANKGAKFKWETYDIEGVYEIFAPYATSKNPILRQYAEHITEMHDAYGNTEKPTCNEKGLDYIRWTAYFKNKVTDKIESVLVPGYKVGIYKWQFPYVAFRVELKNGFPYLELQSRNCLDGQIKASVMYSGVDRETKAKFRNALKKSGISFIKTDIDTDDKFISAVREFADEYISVMKVVFPDATQGAETKEPVMSAK